MRTLKLITATYTTMNQRQLVRWLEKYCVNSRIRLGRRQLDEYWRDPKHALKEFDPKVSNIDE